MKRATGCFERSGCHAGNFNPRSREGSDLIGFPIWISAIYFNPRSREGSDVLRVSSVIRVNTISIHAPVKGATQIASGGRWQDVISIHAPVKGATLKYQMEVYITWYFNPRSREGSDHQSVHTWSACTYFNPRSREGSDGADIKRRVFVVISIHAPVKGATPIGTRTICSGIFQSTLP